LVGHRCQIRVGADALGGGALLPVPSPAGPEHPLPPESGSGDPRGGVEHAVGWPEVPDLGPRLAGDRVPGGAEITDGCPWRQPQVVEVAVAVAGDLVADRKSV